MFNALSSVVGGYFSNKFYLETYLVKCKYTTMTCLKC